MSETFRTTIKRGGVNTTGIVIPDGVIERLDAGRKPAVKVTLAGYSYRSTVATRGGEYMVSLSAANREQAGVAGGDEVDVTVELDTAPREIELPEDFAQALAADEQAAAFFRGLSYSKQRWYVEPIGQAKKPETRQRRLEKALAMLREGRTP